MHSWASFSLSIISFSISYSDSNSSFAYYELIRIIRIKANKLELIISSSITQSRLRALNDDEEYVENVCDYEYEDDVYI